MNRSRFMIRIAGAVLAAAAFVFVGVINLCPAAAGTMGRIPVIKNLAQLVTLKRLRYQDEMHKADIRVPKVEGLKNSGLENALNQKYLEENTALYDKFLAEMGQEKLTPEILALFTDFKVKVSTDSLFVVERTKLEIGASGKETVTYDNIDLKNQLVITLPSLFKDDTYVDAISGNILTQMKQQTSLEDGIMYFVGESEDGFVKIDPGQTFYINADSKLVIVFDEYAVAPGCMGIVEFVIPTETIQDVLVSNVYIK